jgi:hypothetical protein
MPYDIMMTKSDIQTEACFGICTWTATQASIVRILQHTIISHLKNKSYTSLYVFLILFVKIMGIAQFIILYYLYPTPISTS